MVTMRYRRASTDLAVPGGNPAGATNIGLPETAVILRTGSAVESEEQSSEVGSNPAMDEP